MSLLRWIRRLLGNPRIPLGLILLGATLACGNADQASTVASQLSDGVVTAVQNQSTQPSSINPPQDSVSEFPKTNSIPPIVQSPVTPATVEVALDMLDIEEAKFVVLINNYRSQNGLSPLKVSKTLTLASRWLSEDMANQGYFSHTDLLGRDPFTRMRDFGYRFSSTMAENIAAGNAQAQATFTQWQNSAGHNKNMLGAAYKAIGVGRAGKTGSTYGWYWTTDFGGTVDF